MNVALTTKAVDTHRRFGRSMLLASALRLLAADGAITSSVAAEETSARASSPDVFSKPSLLRGPKSEYVADDKRGRLDGWVELRLMVDAAGTGYEVTVAESSGNADLERAAVSWVGRSKFEPARLNGVAVEGSYAYRFVHMTQPANGNSVGSDQNYAAAHAAIARGDRAAADAALRLIRTPTLADQGSYNFMRYEYMVRWGNPQQQLDALKAAIAHRNYNARQTPNDSLARVWPTLFKLQVETGDFSAALQTYALMDAETRSKPAIATVRTRIDELAADHRPFSVGGEITGRGAWFLRLLKRRFSIDVLDGEVAELKVRCERKLVKLPYQAGLQHTISPGNGMCELEVLGKPGTKFKLTQS